MRSTLGDRKDVVDLVDRGQFSFFQTRLTKRMLAHIAVTDSFPGAAVGFIDPWIALEFIVSFPLTISVYFTELSVRKVGTAGVSTSSFGSLRH